MTIDEKLERELRPIINALKQHLGAQAPIDEASLKYLARDYYDIHGVGVNEKAIKSMIDGYIMGYGTAKLKDFLTQSNP